MEQYDQMGPEELSQDIYFQQWVLQKDAAGDEFWGKWLKLYPEKALLVEEARSLVIGLQAKEVPHFSGEEVREGIHAILAATQSSSPRLRLGDRWLRVAASILLIGTMGWFLLKTKSEQEGTKEHAVLSDKWSVHSNPGNSSSTFTLADGSKIVLGPYSTLQYAPDFGKNTREVYLKGTAFFEVTKDAQRPFLVTSGKLVTKVIGTSFTISAYEQEPAISVAVKTGKVTVFNQVEDPKMHHQALSTEMILLPNQKAVFDKQKEMLIKTLVDQPIPVQQEVKKEEWTFVDAKAGEVFATLEAKYGIKMIYDAEVMDYCTITIDFDQESLYEKLDLICEIIQAKYKITDGQIVIDGLGCPQ